MSKNWNPSGGFPSAEQVERMVAAEVKPLAECEYARERGIEEKQESRNVAAITLSAWRGLFALDMVALADAGSREDFDDLEFLVTRALGELNGVKNLLALARRLA